MLVFAATFCVPAAGVVDFKKNEAVLAPAAAFEPAPDPFALEGAGCFGVDPPVTMSTTTTTAMAVAAPTRSTHGRRRNGLPARDSRTFMTSTRSRRRLTRNWLHAAYGPDHGAMRQGQRNCDEFQASSA